ncbi:hypothetical protein [Myxococcus sp. AB036A]|uniref:hypothetical protein n=1 Tax=Myxococcus sp. AB036A TaxID=2562793 RepID=UPI001E4BBD16|nr:hypothetical protein [Myxococcus sp. AB036A]
MNLLLFPNALSLGLTSALCRGLASALCRGLASALFIPFAGTLRPALFFRFACALPPLLSLPLAGSFIVLRRLAALAKLPAHRQYRLLQRQGRGEAPRWRGLRTQQRPGIHLNHLRPSHREGTNLPP